MPAGKTVNGNSGVLRVRHGGQRILLTGDLNTPSADDFLGLHPAR
jgi:beta-lactamase superfamily II metal-dependent hydrolase